MKRKRKPTIWFRSIEAWWAHVYVCVWVSVCMSYGFTWKLLPYRTWTARNDDDDDDGNDDDKALSSNSLYHSEGISAAQWVVLFELMAFICDPYSLIASCVSVSMVNGVYSTAQHSTHSERALNMLVDIPYGFYFEQCAILFSIRSKHNIAPFVSLSLQYFSGRLSFSAVVCSFFYPSLTIWSNFIFNSTVGNFSCSLSLTLGSWFCSHVSAKPAHFTWNSTTKRITVHWIAYFQHRANFYLTKT